MYPQIWLVDLILKGKSGPLMVVDVICVKLPLHILQKDKMLFWKALRDKSEAFKKTLVIDKSSGFPKLEEVVYKKYLSDSLVDYEV